MESQPKHGKIIWKPIQIVELLPYWNGSSFLFDLEYQFCSERIAFEPDKVDDCKWLLQNRPILLCGKSFWCFRTIGSKSRILGRQTRSMYWLVPESCCWQRAKRYDLRWRNQNKIMIQIHWPISFWCYEIQITEK